MIFFLLNAAFPGETPIQFVDIAAEAGLTFKHENGASKEKLMPETFGSGVAWIDYDNDGDLDIVVADCGGPPLLIRNDGGNRNHWIAIRARGSESNRFGVGAKVRVTAGGRTQLREINPSGSYLSTSDVRLYIGLGAEAGFTRLEIEWPSGKKQVLQNGKADQVLVLEESNAGR